MGWNSNPSANSRVLTGRQRAQFRDAVFIRYGNRCRQCGDEATAADHVIPIWKGGDPTDVTNGQPLCGPCHDRKSRREAAEARRLARRPVTSYRHPNEKHPGLR